MIVSDICLISSAPGYIINLDERLGKDIVTKKLSSSGISIE